MRGAKKIIAALEKAGCDAYLVGGVVRDTLLGRECHDIDIATSAGTYETICVAKAHRWPKKEVGKAFGCIVVTVGGNSYEVTSFRGEAYADDAHRPAQIVYGVSLEEDVKRRDFTINGMVMTADGKLIDLVGGQADLESRLIRCIGDGRRRFAEDVLRAFRACRFSAQLNFDLHEDIIPAIQDNLERVKGLSIERVRVELEKTLVAPYCARGLDAMMESGLLATSATARAHGKPREVAILPELVHLAGLRQNPRYHAYDAWNHTLAVVETLPPELTVRWAGLLHDVAKGMEGIRGEKDGQPTDYGHAEAGAQMAQGILRRLGYSNAFAKRVAWLVREHMGCAPRDKKGALRWLKKRAVDFNDKDAFLDALRQLNLLLQADDVGTGRAREGNRADLFEETFELAKNTVLFVNELKVGGKDLVSIIGEGPHVRRQLERLLVRVTEGELCNEKSALIEATVKFAQKNADAFAQEEAVQRPKKTKKPKTERVAESVIPSPKGLPVEEVRIILDRAVMKLRTSQALSETMKDGFFEKTATVMRDELETEVAILPEIVRLIGVPYAEASQDDVWTYTMCVMDELPSKLAVRWAGLLHNIAKGTRVAEESANGRETEVTLGRRSAQMAQEILTRLEYSESLIDRVIWLVREHVEEAPSEEEWMNWLRRQAVCFEEKADLVKGLRQLRFLLRAIRIATGRRDRIGREEIYGELICLAKDTVLYEEELAVSKQEVLEAVGEQKIDAVMRELLAGVTEGRISNDQEELLQAAEAICQAAKAKCEPSA